MVQASHQGLLLSISTWDGSLEHQTGPGSCKSPPCPSLAEVTPRISPGVPDRGAQSSQSSHLAGRSNNCGCTSSIPSLPRFWADLSPQPAAPAAGSCSFITLFLSGAAAKDKPERRPPLSLSGSSSIWSCSSWRPFKGAARQLPSTCQQGRSCLLLPGML